MTSVYKLCKALIERGRTEGLVDKMDAYLAVDRLTVGEYDELMKMLGGGSNE